MRAKGLGVGAMPPGGALREVRTQTPPSGPDLFIRRWSLLLGSAVALIGASELNVMLKGVFRRLRPILTILRPEIFRRVAHRFEGQGGHHLVDVDRQTVLRWILAAVSGFAYRWFFSFTSG
jgi:hypothetical protein